MPTLSTSSPLLLASGSPRRRELLESVRLPIVARPVDLDEAEIPGEDPDAYLDRIVRGKLGAARRLDAGSCAALLVADTIVVAQGAILQKPRSVSEAIAMIASLSGRAHEVKTRFWLELAGAAKSVATTITTRVHVRPLPETWIERYARSGEGADKAGSYAVQGLFAFAIERIEGSYTNVVGLPLCEVVQALDDIGLIPNFLEP